MNGFIPEQPKSAQEVPYFEDVSSSDGWQGQTTGKSIEALKSEITIAISRLGGTVVGFQRGTFYLDGKNREGFRIHCTLEGKDGKLTPARIEIAALPIKEKRPRRRGDYSKDNRLEQSLKMALFMFRNAIQGQWFMSQLSPGYAPLMPFILINKDKTISQLWAEDPVMNRLLPSGAEGEQFVVDGEIREAKE